MDPTGYPMKPGDCGFPDGLFAHGAGANMTRCQRIAMPCPWLPDGRTCNGNRNVLPQDDIDSLNGGDVLENDELNPVVYRMESPTPA